MGVIDVNGVACRTPDGADLLRDVSFTVGDGDHVALLGANGAGHPPAPGGRAGQGHGRAPPLRHPRQRPAAFETLSGGQQARLQILLLELAGSTLLLLDEPTDNLDLASAETLEEALGSYVGTVVAVSHDRWFLRSFDRFLVFDRNARVREHLEPVFV